VENIVDYSFASINGHIDRKSNFWAFFRFVKNSANQKRDIKIVASDWLFRFLQGNLKLWNFQNCVKNFRILLKIPEFR
jgi:hypothetical protein